MSPGLDDAIRRDKRCPLYSSIFDADRHGRPRGGANRGKTSDARRSQRARER